MPGERRNLRSNKESSSSTNGEKARSNSQSSNSKDKPVPTRATSSKSKAPATKKASAKDGSDDKPQSNGTEPIENGVNGGGDIDMLDEESEKVKFGKEGEDMTVVVPPPNSSKLSGEPRKNDEGDLAMDETDAAAMKGPQTEHIDPMVKAFTGSSSRISFDVFA